MDRPLVAPLDELLGRARAEALAYARAEPGPHAVIDGLFDERQLELVAAELPDPTAQGWRTYDTSRELKRVFDKVHLLGPTARRLALELNGSEFVQFLECLTGIGGLIPDPHLRQAGYFDVPTGGFLSLHTDFTTSTELRLVRRVNALVYLNEGWREEWGGQLELWRSVDDGPVVQVVPTLGRLVVFSTPGVTHGHPRPVAAPGDRSRLCFSAYYYTPAEDPNVLHERAPVLWGNEQAPTARARHLLSQMTPPIVANAFRRGRRARRRRRAQKAQAA